MEPRVSVIIPTLNEAENLPLLLPSVAQALGDVSHEILVVDDASPDGTADVAEAMAADLPSLRVVRRAGTPGLSAAVLDGFELARGRFLGVMDADLQHDVRVLPRLVAALDQADIALGSRYAFEGGIANWSRIREAQSRLAGWVTRQVLRLSASDPLSGFFAVRRSVVDEIRQDLQPRGWKILLEILGRAPWARVEEVPFTFGPRLHGRTKMSSRVIMAWLGQLAALSQAHQVPRGLQRIRKAKVREAIS